MTNYDRAYGTAAELAAACVRQLQSELDGVPDSELEGYLRVAYAAIVKRYGKSAAQVAVEQYAETRERQQVAEAYEPTVYEPSNDGLLRWDVSDALSRGTETNPRVDLEALGRHSMRRTMEYADYTMDRNCAADPAKAKWGLVPHAGACAWCVYIAGFGFTYNSEGTASRGRHSGCKCSLQVSFGDGRWPDGYDPDGMRERANSCRAAVESDAQRAWAAMGENERREVAGGTGSRAYQRYLSKRTVAEMRTRDADWLRTGKAKAVDYSENPRRNYGTLVKAGDYSADNIVDRGNEWRDLWAHHALESNGFSVATHGSGDIDLTVNGQLWEVKSPQGGGTSQRFVESSVRAAREQFASRDVSAARIVFNPRYRDWDRDAMKSELRRQMKQHGATEALFVNDDGTLERLYP